MKSVFYADDKKRGFWILIIIFIGFIACLWAIYPVTKIAYVHRDFVILAIIIPAIVILVLSVAQIPIVLFSLSHMRYELRDDALYLIIGPWKDKVSYNEINSITVKDLLLNPLSSFRLPGVALFNVAYSDEGTVRMYSTHALKDVVLIKTLNKKYGISPKDEEGFIAALQSKIKNHGVVKVKISEEVGLIGKESQPKRFSVVEIIVWLIVVASFIVGIYFYPRLPQKIVVHWDASGNVNGYLPKFPAIFLIPFLFSLLSLLPIIIPKGSSQEIYRKFKLTYYLAIFLVFIVMFFAYLYMLLWNIGVKMNFNIFFPILITGIVISIIVQLILFKKNKSI